MSALSWTLGLTVMVSTLTPLPLSAGQSAELPVTRGADLNERLGAKINPSLSFTDQTGTRTSLARYLDGRTPVVLVLAYYGCPMLCGLVLQGAVHALRRVDLRLGESYQAVTVSFDPRDTPESAHHKRESTLAGVDPGAGQAAAWPFLVGDSASINRLANDVGFHVAYDARTDQYAHPAALIVLTGDGRVSRYLYGVEYSPRDLRLALVEAGKGEIGSLVDRVLITCYRYDPATRTYGPFVVGFLRLGAGLTLLFVVAVVGLSVAASRRRRAPGWGER